MQFMVLLPAASTVTVSSSSALYKMHGLSNET